MVFKIAPLQQKLDKKAVWEEKPEFRLLILGFLVLVSSECSKQNYENSTKGDDLEEKIGVNSQNQWGLGPS